jgi:hypothetical protein
MTEEDARTAAQEHLDSMGYTMDLLIENERQTDLYDKLYDYVTKDLTGTEEEMSYAYIATVTEWISESQVLYKVELN